MKNDVTSIPEPANSPWGLAFDKLLPIFTVLCTVLLGGGFLFKGSCNEGQWWLGLLCAVVVTIFLVRRSVSSRVILTGIAVALGYLAFLWLLAGCWVGQSVDESEYRFPAVRLLMMGWNPVWEGVFGKGPFVDSLVEGCRAWHVLYMPRGVEMFSALYAKAWRAPLAMSLGLPLFLLPSVIRLAFRLPNFSTAQSWACLLPILCGLSLPEAVVGNVIYLSSIGLAFAMYVSLVTRKFEWVALLVYSFWMMTAKQTSLLSCFVFWVLFVAIWCWQRRTCVLQSMKPIVLAGGLLTGLWAIVCASPYLTSWVRHGHPLWPTYAQGGETVKDLTGDFHVRNQDAQRMGHLGLFVNAYVSESLSLAYYRWLENDSTFHPSCLTWRQGNRAGDEAQSPTNPSERGLLIMSTLVLLLLGRGGERLFVACFWVSLLLFPTPYLGYLRYAPWWILIQGVALAILLRTISRYSVRFEFVGGCACMAAGACSLLFHSAPAIDAAWELAPYRSERRIMAMGAPKGIQRANLELLRTQLPEFVDTQICSPKEEAVSRELEGAREFSLRQVEFLVLERESPRYATLSEARKKVSRMARYRAYLVALPIIYCIELPELMVRRVAEVFGLGERVTT